jgi:hypothetical protein
LFHLDNRLVEKDSGHAAADRRAASRPGDLRERAEGRRSVLVRDARCRCSVGRARAVCAPSVTVSATTVTAVVLPIRLGISSAINGLCLLADAGAGCVPVAATNSAGDGMSFA